MTPTPPPDEPLLALSPRGIRYLTAILIVVGGILCGAIIPGTLGGSICTGLVGVGCVGIVSMIFYDVGLSEDRDRARLDRMRGRLDGGSDRAAGATSPVGPEHETVRRRAQPLRRLRGERRHLS